MNSSEHVKHIESLIKLSTMTNQEKQIILNAFKDFIYNEIKKGSKNE